MYVCIMAAVWMRCDCGMYEVIHISSVSVCKNETIVLSFFCYITIIYITIIAIIV